MQFLTNFYKFFFNSIQLKNGSNFFYSYLMVYLTYFILLLLFFFFQCAPHTWSISSEFQLFALALLNVYLYNRSKKIGLCFNILIIIFGISYLGVISFIKNLPPIWLPKQSFGHQ